MPSLMVTDQQQTVLGNLARLHAYTPFGSGGRLGLAFNGELQEVGGRYLLGHGYRAFNPQLMRFVSPDSWSPFGAGGLNAYAYCLGDPVNARDPTGHMPSGRKFLQKMLGKSKPNRYKHLSPSASSFGNEDGIVSTGATSSTTTPPVSPPMSTRQPVVTTVIGSEVPPPRPPKRPPDTFSSSDRRSFSEDQIVDIEEIVIRKTKLNDGRTFVTQRKTTLEIKTGAQYFESEEGTHFAVLDPIPRLDVKDFTYVESRAYGIRANTPPPVPRRK